MHSDELRAKFLEFFRSRGHAVAPSSSLLPDDPSVLLTTAGVQQFKPYYTGDADPLRDFGSKNTVSAQKSFRTSDIDEVGDETHLTFFEMLGNFSFGGYFKEEAIKLAYEFITKELGLEISFVTVFEGLESIGVPEDTQSQEIWKQCDANIKIEKQGMEDVFWGPTGNSGPCGPTTEIYCRNGAGEDVEIWNIVFNEYFFSGSREELLSGSSGKKLEPLDSPGVDTGMGLERLAMITQKKNNIFETDLYASISDAITVAQEKDNTLRIQRIIADHIRAAAFLIADGVRPSNKEAGYILRRLLRRILVFGINIKELLLVVIEQYGEVYDDLSSQKEVVLQTVEEESVRFSKTVQRGLRELEKIESVNAESAFSLYESYGLPYEVIKDFEDGARAKKLTREAFDEEFRKHQEKSRAGQEKKFGGHGLILDTGELKAADERELKIVTRLHTATHLLNAALRKVLGPDIEQQGSDITVERTRFDFTFPRKLTPEEIQQVEGWVNDVIARDLPMECKEMAYEDAIKTNAIRFFKEKYPERVTVYTVHNPETGEVFSREFCGGPHVTHTGEIGHFKITKEQSSSAGIRRIRAVVE